MPVLSAPTVMGKQHVHVLLAGNPAAAREGEKTFRPPPSMRNRKKTSRSNYLRERGRHRCRIEKKLDLKQQQRIILKKRKSE